MRSYDHLGIKVHFKAIALSVFLPLLMPSGTSLTAWLEKQQVI